MEGRSRTSPDMHIGQQSNLLYASSWGLHLGIPQQSGVVKKGKGKVLGVSDVFIHTN